MGNYTLVSAVVLRTATTTASRPHGPHGQVPGFLTTATTLDPAATRAFAPAAGEDGSAPQSPPDTGSPASANLFSFLTLQKTTTEPQVTQPTRTQTHQAENQNPPAQNPALPVSESAAQHPPAFGSPVQNTATQNQPAQGQGQSTQRTTAQGQNAPSQSANLPATDSPARKLSSQDLPVQSSPTQDQPVQGQGQSAQIKPGLNQNLPAQLPSTQVDPEISTPVAWVQAVVVQSQTIVQGASDVLISGATVKYSAGSIYVGNNAAPVSAAPQPQPPQQKGPEATLIGGLKFTPVQQDVSGATGFPAVVVSGQILTNNGPAATIDGQIVAYSSGSIHVGTSVVAAPTAASQQQQDVSPSNAVIGGLTVIPVQQGPPAATDGPEVNVQGHKLKEGSKAITIDGTLVAYSSGFIHVGTNVAPAPTFASQQNPEIPPQVLGGFTFTPLLLPGSQSSAAPLVVGGQTVSIDSYGAMIGTNAILPGAAPITISATPVSFGPGGLVVGSQTYGTSGSYTKYVAGSNFATVAGQAISIGPTGAIVIGSTTLTPGGSPITISGTAVSLGATALVIGSSTLPLPLEATAIQSVITVAGTTFTANPTAFRIAGTTLSANGAAITISGTPISLGPSGLVIGTSTIALKEPATASPTGLGGVILQGLGPVGSSTTLRSTSTSMLTPESFAGSAAPATRVQDWGLGVWGILAACMLCVALAL